VRKKEEFEIRFKFEVENFEIRHVIELNRTLSLNGDSVASFPMWAASGGAMLTDYSRDKCIARVSRHLGHHKRFARTYDSLSQLSHTLRQAVSHLRVYFAQTLNS
jgi:hypothetical protein